jgi:hypothetical protein
MIKLKRFYKKSDNGDWTRAMRAAMEVSREKRDRAILLPCDYMRFTEPITFTSGTPLIGSGAVGTNLDQGSVLAADFDNAAAFVWNGLTKYRGGGAILRDFNVTAHKGRRPGAALTFLAATPEQRPGKVEIDNVSIYAGVDAGTFEIGLVVDGSRVKVPGSVGVRSVIANMRINGCRTLAAAFWAAVHARVTLETNPIAGVGHVSVGGGSEDVDLFGRIYGTLEITDSKEVTVFARASRYCVSDKAFDAWLPRAKEIERTWTSL